MGLFFLEGTTDISGLTHLK